MNVVLKPVENELVITRELKAPRERVFAAWTDVAQAARWWAPRDFTLLSCEMDVQPGGRWHRRMRAADGAVFVKQGVYREIVPPERLVFTYQTDEGGIVDGETVVTVTFEDLGGRTRLTLHHTGFDGGAARLSHEGGWQGAIERVERFLAG